VPAASFNEGFYQVARSSACSRLVSTERPHRNLTVRRTEGADVSEVPRTRRVALRELRAAVLAKQKAEADLRDLYREREIQERGPPSVTRRPC